MSHMNCCTPSPTSKRPFLCYVMGSKKNVQSVEHIIQSTTFDWSSIRQQSRFFLLVMRSRTYASQLFVGVMNQIEYIFGVAVSKLGMTRVALLNGSGPKVGDEPTGFLCPLVVFCCASLFTVVHQACLCILVVFRCCSMLLKS
jgi:hypothetical protein